MIRPSKNRLYPALYFLCIIIFHQQINNLSVYLSNMLTLERYSLMLNVAQLSAFCGFVLFVMAWKKTGRRRFVSVWCMYGILLWIANTTILVVPAEMIHIPQYMILALLLTRVIANPHHVLLYTTVLGTIDELYQYGYLRFGMNDNYVDFNDVVLNALGAIGGLLLLWTFRSSHKPATLESR